MNNTTQVKQYAGCLEFALQMEENNLSELLRHAKEAPETLLPVMNQFLIFQQHFLQILKEAALLKPDAALPTVSSNIIPDEAEWQLLLAAYAEEIQNPAQHFLRLWLLNSIFEKTAVFYRQVSNNSSDLKVRLFTSSLSELKKMMARRAESILRVNINKSWEQLGFCPFPLN